MSERSIFLNALDREDPAARAAYLDEACAGRPELRQRIERLLESHHTEDRFLEVPAMEQLAIGDRALAFLAPAAEPGTLGRLDHYDVLEVVGRGATGVVLKARDTKLQRVVAIKVLATRLAASGAARRRFVQEAQAAAAVRDDHVTAIYAVSDDGPVPYLVMECIHGMTLADRVKQSGRLELKEILRIGVQVAKGLAAAHAQGLVHRDIKPANILLENSVQRVKITDFGLALAAAGGDRAAGRAIVGTPLFMSPEQARGEPTDHRSDLFSLGSVLYTLCTGHPPFAGDSTAATLKSVCEDRPRPVREANPDVPEWLCELIGKLHVKDVQGRFASTRDVADLLGHNLALVQQPPTAPEAPPKLEVKAPAARSGRLRFFVACLIGVVSAMTALAAYGKWRQTRSPDTEPKETRPIKLELRREDIPPRLLALAGAGDPAKAPPELAGVLGDGKFLLPRVGQTAWMEQSPDGKLLAVPLDEDVALFETPAGTYLRTLKGPGERVFQVTFSRDNQLLAASTRSEAGGGAVRVWDLAGDRELFTNPQPGPTAGSAMAFSGDGQHLFTEGNGRIRVWESRTGASAHEIEVERRGVGQISVSPDGRRLAATVFFDECVKVFDWDGKKLTEVRTLKGHSPLVGAVAYSPDGKYLASGTENEFKLWNADTLELIRTCNTAAQQLAFAPDSQTLFATQTVERPKPVHTFTRWDVASGKELPALAVEVAVAPVRAFHCLSRDGKTLFVTPQHAATHIRAISTDTGKELFPREGHVAPLNAVAVSPDGRKLASAGEDRVVKVWDLVSGRMLQSFAVHNDAVWGLAFDRDGKLLASGSRDGTVALWDVERGTELRALHGHSHLPSRVQFSPDGKTLAAGGEQGVVTVWDAASGRPRMPLPGHSGAVRCVAFSRSGNLLAAGGDNKTVLVHDFAGGGWRTFKTASAVNDVAFSSDGHTLAAVGDGPATAVQVWNLDTEHEIALEGHTGNIHGLAFSPTEPLLATGGDDGTVRLWDLSTGGAGVRTIGPGPFGGPVRSVAFTPDGRYLATANANGTLYLLRVVEPR
jgi:WD40 repeat protein/serine/threonine protein kinase